MEAARNWWLELGEPDYATCGQLFCCLPQELRNQFNRSQEHTFLWVFFMAWVKGYRAGRATNYAQVAQGWIGEQIGRGLVDERAFPIDAAVKQLRRLFQRTAHLIAAVGGAYGVGVPRRAAVSRDLLSVPRRLRVGIGEVKSAVGG